MFPKEETPLPPGCLCEQFTCSVVVSHDSSLHRFSNKYSLVIFSMKVQDTQFAQYSVGQQCHEVIKKIEPVRVFLVKIERWIPLMLRILHKKKKKLFWLCLCARLIQLQG